MNKPFIQASLLAVGLIGASGFKASPPAVFVEGCLEDTGPVSLQIAQGDHVVLRLVGEEYQALDGVRVVHGASASAPANHVSVSLGQWAEGERHLTIQPSGTSAPGRHYRVEGLAQGVRTIVLPTEIEITVSPTTPFVKLPAAVGLPAMAQAPGQPVLTAEVSYQNAAINPREAQQRVQRDRNPSAARTRGAGEARTAAARTRARTATTAVVKRPTEAAQAAQARAARVTKRYPAVDAQAATAVRKRRTTDRMLTRAEREGIVPLGCTVRVHASSDVNSLPTVFFRHDPETPATTGAELEITGTSFPELEVYLGDQPLEVLESTSTRVRALLPAVATSGALYAVRKVDGAWARLDDEYAIVEPEVQQAFDFMNADAPGSDSANAYLMAAASLKAYVDTLEMTLEDYSNRLENEFSDWGLELVEAFHEGGYLSGTLGSDTQGFIATNDEIMVIAFAGTQKSLNYLDFATDVNILLVPAPLSWGDNGIYVHQGFMRAADAKLHDGSTLHEKVLQAAATAQAEGKKIWITGHSLGGALAMLVAYRLSHVNDIDIQGVVTFGTPRVGNPGFAEAYDAEFGGRSQRWVNFNDPIPAAPPILAGFQHPGVLFNIDADGGVDTSGDEMYYDWGPNVIHHALHQHNCYFGILEEMFLGPRGDNDPVTWPAVDPCTS